MSERVFLNGSFVPARAARVSVFDRGFLFGDAAYEVIPVYRGRAFCFEQHLARLARSLRELDITVAMQLSHWQTIVDELLRDSGPADVSIYIQVSRGAGENRDAAAFAGLEPTVLVSVAPVSVDRTLLRAGVRTALLEDIRWHNCHIKATALLGNILLRKQAQERGAMEALLHRDGVLTEGSSSNSFFVVDGEIRTAPADHRILRGITRDVVIGLARDCGMMLREEAVSLAELAAASEAFICSSIREVVPVTHIDEQMIGRGGPGPVTERIMAAFAQMKLGLAEAA